MKLRPLIQKLVFIIAVMVLLIGVCEITSRLIWSKDDLCISPIFHFIKDDPTLFWIQKPNLDSRFRGNIPLKTNSLGLRSPEIEIPKPEGVYRILSLGESTTWGDLVEEQDTYSRMLEGILNDPAEGFARTGKKFEVVNAGVGAYTIWQSYIYLIERGVKLQPNMVMIYHQSNDNLSCGVIDPSSWLYKIKYTDRRLYERRSRFKNLFKLLYRSRAYLRLRKSILTLPSDLPVSQPGKSGKPRVPYEDRVRALEGILNACKQAGAKFVIIQPHYFFNNPKDILLREFAKKHSMPYVDLPRLMADARSELGVDALLFRDGMHPTTKGHGLYANAIAKELADIFVRENID